MTATEASKLIGKLLDRRYRMVRVLAAGGFGHTYLAEDTRRPNHPLCVVKQLKPTNDDPSFLEMALKMFQREAEILERMGVHPQIPQLLAYFEEDGEFYIIQQYIDGLPLTKELSARQKWAENRVRSFLAEMLSILSFIHENGVIHRDVKPSNILRQKSDGKLFLIDFGAIKQLQSPSATQAVLTSATISIGTPGYMAVEQGMGKPRPGSDIFGLGTTAIQAVTGIHPSNLREDEEGELIWQPFTENLSVELLKFLTKMVRAHFKERFKDGTEALKALSQLPSLAVDVDALLEKDTQPIATPQAVTKPDFTVVESKPIVPSAPMNNGVTQLNLSTQNTTEPQADTQLSFNSQIPNAPVLSEGVSIPEVSKFFDADDKTTGLITSAEPEPEPVSVVSPAKPKHSLLQYLGWLAIPIVGGLAITGWQIYQNQQTFQREQAFVLEIQSLQSSASYEKCLGLSYEFKTELGDTFREVQKECRQRLQQKNIQSAQELLKQKKFTEAIALAQQIPTPEARKIINQASDQIAQQIRANIQAKGELSTIEQINRNLPKDYTKYAEIQTQLKKYQATWNKEKETVNKIKQAFQAQRWQEVADLSAGLTIPKWKGLTKSQSDRARQELAARFTPPPTPPSTGTGTGTSFPTRPSYNPPPPVYTPPVNTGGDRPPLDAAGQ